MRPLLYIIVLFLFGSISAQGQESDAERLFAYFKKLSGFDNQYPREKVYLHTDNDAYMEGETLWFRAYVVRASTLRPDPVSKVLYVELLDDCGRIVQRRLLRLDSLGRAEGDIPLEVAAVFNWRNIHLPRRSCWPAFGTEMCGFWSSPPSAAPMPERERSMR